MKTCPSHTLKIPKSPSAQCGQLHKDTNLLQRSPHDLALFGQTDNERLFWQRQSQSPSRGLEKAPTPVLYNVCSICR